MTDNMTLNLGLRWDYFGVPYDKNGMALTIVGGGDRLFGRSGTGYDNWLAPGERGTDTEFIFVGPNSPNPGLSVYPRDLNNFGPAVGFSYSIPWLGRDRTVFRGGYQLSYLIETSDTVSGIIQNAPGSSVQGRFEGLGAGTYFNMQDVVNGVGVPTEPAFLPVLPVPVTDRGVDLEVYSPEYTTPYVQNLTASITHTFNPTFTLDVKYVSTLSRKLANSFDININNYFNNGLFEAFEDARAGGESDLLNALFAGVDMRTSRFAGPTIVGQNGLTGAEFLRTDTRFRGQLANGAFNTIAGTLNDLNYDPGYNPGLPDIPTNSDGNLLRVQGFPENFIVANPQFGDAELRSNMGYRNYHSMQTQLTVRPIFGIQNTFSYTWAKNLGNTGNYVIPYDRGRRDYRLDSRERAGVFTAYGTFNLPIGPNQALLGNSSGFVARVAEGWQMSWIYNASTGTPMNIEAARGGFYGGDVPVLVDGASLGSSGEIVWEDGAASGSYFRGFERDDDPQCTSALVAPSIQGFCTLNALYDSSGNLVFRTTEPGEFGNFTDQLKNPGRWDLDMSLSKRVQINERMSINVRIDGQNVFNHPTPANPEPSIQSGADFGSINTKSGTAVSFSNFGRVFQMKARLDW